MDYTRFSEFMGRTTDLLCERIQARRGTIVFVLGNYHGSGAHFDAEVRLADRTNLRLCVACECRMDPVIYHAMSVLHRYLSRNVSLRPETDSGWFFNTDGGVFHTPITLAEELYRTVSAELADRYSLVTGVNISLLSSIIQESYETSRASGTFAFVDTSLGGNQLEKLMRTQLRPVKPVMFEPGQKRYIRKLLQGAGGDILLLTRAGAGEPYRCAGYVGREANERFHLTANILRRDTWSFRFAKQDVFKVRMGDILCLQDPLEMCLPELAYELDKQYVEPMHEAVKAVSEQMHGTSMIFLDLDDPAASGRIERLKAQGRALEIKRIPITRSGFLSAAGGTKGDGFSSLTKLAGVDGALVVDYPRGELAYINAILDGEAIVPGEPASGARRNVVSCFIANLVREAPKVKAAALIFSEDGGCRLVTASELRAELASAGQSS